MQGFSISSDRKKNKSTLFFDRIKKERLTFILNTLLLILYLRGLEVEKSQGLPPKLG
jgi:hypothetical protein